MFEEALKTMRFAGGVMRTGAGRKRVLEAMRESGTLLMTFTPLDGALRPSDFWDNWLVLTGLFVGGLLLFGAAVVNEGRANLNAR